MLHGAATSSASGAARARSAASSRLSVLAACALPLLGYEAWTIAGWATDHPHQITRFRDYGATAWIAARVVEALVIASVAGFAWWAVRERRREGRLGVDALLMIGMGTAAFWDPIYNWRVPAWLYSSDLLNVNDWFGHAPGVVNADAGRQPWPVVIVLVGYPLWGVGFAMVGNRVMSYVATRRHMGRGRLIVVAFLASGALTVAAFAVFQALGLMTAPGYRFAIFGNSELPFFFYSGGLVFGGLACLRWFGRAIFSAPGPRTAIRLLAAIAACQLIVILGWGLLTVPFSERSSSYPVLPAHLLNGLCDLPGDHGSAYGPCPGQRGK